jgi:hypothetical protein
MKNVPVLPHFRLAKTIQHTLSFSRLPPSCAAIALHVGLRDSLSCRSALLCCRYLREHASLYMTFLPAHYKRDPGLLTLAQLIEGVLAALQSTRSSSAASSSASSAAATASAGSSSSSSSASAGSAGSSAAASLSSSSSPRAAGPPSAISSDEQRPNHYDDSDNFEEDDDDDVAELARSIVLCT